MTDKTLIIANPVSGGGRGRAFGERAAARIRSRGQVVHLALTSGRGDASALAERARDDGIRRIGVCGGDGSINEAINALAGTDSLLGLIPCGRGNDLARALGAPVDPERAADILLDGKPRSIDLGRVNGRHFATVATLGFDSEVARLVYEKAVPFSGTLAYVLGVLKTLARYRGVAIRLTGDFGAVEERVLLVATGNTPFYGGGMRILPDAVPDDGLLDICLVRMMSRIRTLRLFPSVFWGGHRNHPDVRMLRTGSVVIETPEPALLFADGEPAGHTPAEIGVVRHAINILVPDHNRMTTQG